RFDSPQGGRRVADALPVSQAAADRQPLPIRVLEPPHASGERLRVDGDHHIETVSGFRSEEIWCRDADDRKRPSIERNRPADRIARTTEFGLPELMTEDRDRTFGAARFVIV